MHTRATYDAGRADAAPGDRILDETGVVILLTLVVVSALLTFIYFHETRELTERFGEEYLEYQKRTPFLLPCLKRQNG